MSLTWPWALFLLAFLPLFVWTYWRSVRRRGEAAVVYPHLALLTRAGAEGRRWSRYLPALLYLASLALLILALARPSLAIPRANPQAGVILALDVSRSMAAGDVKPNRFTAAQNALKAFVRELPEGARVGLVIFARYARLVVPLTSEHHRVMEAVNLLEMDFGTTIGDGLMESVQALPSLEERKATGEDPYKLATVILLSDGRNYGGVDPLEAAAEAARQQVTVHTIGVGSVTEGPIPGIEPRLWWAARFDEETLRSIAQATGGEYYFVDSASALKQTYSDLSRSVVWDYHRDEATGYAVMAAVACLLASLLLGEWRRRVI
ncbi:vWA domain-containing protein [Calidithermus chliarophilus]|uniref:vWA domain-containing protein n=1 Tax=Calidithermus chliarophilus TaxID=52023 RepID=UPI0004282465|nr:VWA domain-containing protein [Calidithermus chliarophilus]